jgi:hypothetical protein
VPASTELALPSSTARRFGAATGVFFELCTDVAGLDAWLWKTCDDEGESLYALERWEPERRSELA